MNTLLKNIKIVLFLTSTITLPSVLNSQEFGNALEFDGFKDYVFMGNDTSLQVDQFTLTAWVHPYSYSGPIPQEQRMEIFEKAGEYWMNISTNGGYERSKGEVRVGGIFEGQWYFLDSEFIVPLKEWTHVACTYDADSLKLYINGTCDVTKAIPENHTDKLKENNMLALGCKCVSSEFGPIEAQFHGILDEMSIWNTALSQVEIGKIMIEGIDESHNKHTELRAYYRLDEDRIGDSTGIVEDALGKNEGANFGAQWILNTMQVPTAIHNIADNMVNLHQNYPNPFEDITYISFGLDMPALVQVEIYDLSGKRIQNLVSKFYTQGTHNIKWDASGLQDGIYLCKLKVGQITEVRKCILRRNRIN